jgi:hypothetical protein
MANARPLRCKVCGRDETEVGTVSWRGKCKSCRDRICNANDDALHYHRGPELLRWRRAVAHSVGAVLLDDLEQRA